MSASHQIVLDFPGDGPAVERRTIEFEEILRDELQTGSVSHHEASNGSTHLVLRTSSPSLCLTEVNRLALECHTIPAAVTCETLSV